MSKTELALEIAKIENKVYGFSLPQLRMQALEVLRSPDGLFYSDNGMIGIFRSADLIVHYCLTGEHQLPEKKDD